MTAHLTSLSRRDLLKGGALIVGFNIAGTDCDCSPRGRDTGGSGDA